MTPTIIGHFSPDFIANNASSKSLNFLLFNFKLLGGIKMKRSFKKSVGGIVKNVSDVLRTAFLFSVHQFRKLNQRVFVDSFLRVLELLCLFGGIYEFIGNLLPCLVIECGQQAVYVAAVNPISIFMHEKDEKDSEDEKPATPIEYDDYDREQMDNMATDGCPNF